MLKTDLLELIINGKNSGTEFKRDDCRPEWLAKEMVAMVNSHGGMILLGVEDDGEISGIQRENLESWVMDDVAANKVHPPILPYYQEIEVDDGKRVAVLTFTQGVSKPYVRRHAGREDAFIRIGGRASVATREQRHCLFEVGSGVRSELLPVSGTTIESLDTERLEDYLANIISDPDIPTTEEGWTCRLLNLGFLSDQVDSAPACTLAGLLLFGNNPRRHLRQAGIRLTVFEGPDKGYQSKLDEILNMPMVGLWKMESGDMRNLASDGIVESSVKMLKPFVSEESEDINEDMQRGRKWHYPIEVLRELLVNAIAHRDWTQLMGVEIAVYSDRLEITSPGAMQNPMTVEKMIAGRRLPRNVLIADILKDYGYDDARGMGVRNTVIPLMESGNNSEPAFETTENHFKTILYRKAA